MTRLPSLGFGVGLRPKHYRDFLEGAPRVDFVEAIAENFMGIGGRPRAVLEKVRADRPVVLHGVSLGIASTAELDGDYLQAWKALVTQVQPAVVSDHLCWGRAHGRYAHDLLPVPFTEEAVRHVVERISRVQDFLGRRIALENVSSYVTFAQSEMTEWEFVSQVVTRADCELLLDVNNVFVSARNHGFDPDAYLAGVPLERVVQIHLAGHQRGPGLSIDTHDAPVSDEVWTLYERVLEQTGPVSTLVEWDAQVPALARVIDEAEQARRRAGTLRIPREKPVSQLPARDAGDSRGLLADTQHTLFAAICDPIEISAQALALVSNRRDGLEAYAGMYWARMRDVLRDAFPAVVAASEDFDGLVAEYLRSHASCHHSLDRLGQHFPGFLARRGNAHASLAAMEWARAEAFVAPDSPVLEWAALTAHPASDWEALSLGLHPSVRLVTGRVVWRQGFEVFDASVSDLEAAALGRAMLGAPLPVVLEPFDADAPAALTALQSWFNEGMVSQLGSVASRDRAD